MEYLVAAVVASRPIGVEQVLELGEGAGSGVACQPLLDPLVGAFVLAAGLRVSDSGRDRLHSQFAEPALEEAGPAASAAGEARTVIGEHLGGQPVA